MSRRFLAGVISAVFCAFLMAATLLYASSRDRFECPPSDSGDWQMVAEALAQESGRRAEPEEVCAWLEAHPQ